MSVEHLISTSCTVAILAYFACATVCAVRARSIRAHEKPAIRTASSLFAVYTVSYMILLGVVGVRTLGNTDLGVGAEVTMMMLLVGIYLMPTAILAHTLYVVVVDDGWLRRVSAVTAIVGLLCITATVVVFIVSMTTTSM